MPRREVYIDQALTNLSTKYNPTGFVADKMAPVVPVVKPSAKYWEWDRLDSFRTYDDLRAPGTEANVIEDNASTAYYSAEERALAAKITDEDKKNHDSVLKLEMSRTKKVKTALMLGREKRVAALYTDLAAYHANLKETLTGTDQWDNASYAGNVIKEIDDMIEGIRKETGQLPNVLNLPYSVANVFKNRPEVLELIKYTNNGLLSSFGLPKVIRGLEVVIPGAAATTGAPGSSTAEISDLWGKNVVVAKINYGDTMDEFSAAYTFRNENFKTDKWRDEPKKTDFVRTTYSEDAKRTSNVAAYIKKDVVS